MLGQPDIDSVIKALIALRDTLKDAGIEVVEVKGFGQSGALYQDEKKECVEMDVRLVVPVGKG